MAARVTLSSYAANIMSNALAQALDNGWMEVYAGERPAGADDPVPSESRLLATLRFSKPAFRQSIGGSATAYGMTRELDAPQTGAPKWYRLYAADHVTVVEDGTVGQLDANLVIPTGVIQEHSEVEVRGFVLAVPKTEGVIGNVFGS